MIDFNKIVLNIYLLQFTKTKLPTATRHSSSLVPFHHHEEDLVSFLCLTVDDTFCENNIAAYIVFPTLAQSEVL